MSKFDTLFSCAGVAEGTPEIERINCVGHRYILEQLTGQGKLRRGSAVCFISSSAGLGWEPHFAKLRELFSISDFDAAAEWLTEKWSGELYGHEAGLVL